MYVDTAQASATALVPDLSKPSVEGLVYLLRHKEMWPSDFRWDYSRLKHCAMGLAYHQWGVIYTPESVARAINIDHEVAIHVFMGGFMGTGFFGTIFRLFRLRAVGPKRIANLLEAHAA